MNQKKALENINKHLKGDVSQKDVECIQTILQELELDEYSELIDRLIEIGEKFPVDETIIEDLKKKRKDLNEE